MSKKPPKKLDTELPTPELSWMKDLPFNVRITGSGTKTDGHKEHSWLVISWSEPGVGFGEATLTQEADEETGEATFILDTENMGRRNVLRYLIELLDKSQTDCGGAEKEQWQELKEKILPLLERKRS